MTDETPAGATTTSRGDVTRRTVVRTAGTAAWVAPTIIAVSAAPASAVSGGAPAVAASGVTGVRRPVLGGIVDCAITFTNDGTLAASALSVVVEFVVAVPGTSLVYGVNDVSAAWTSSPHTVTPGGFRVTFTRAGGLASTASDTLTFTINSPMGTGQIIVSPPTTTPTGANTGSVGVWSDKAAIDMDITSISSPLNNGNIFVTFHNDGLAVAANQTIAVTITPESGTVSFSSSGNTPQFYSVSPTRIEETTNAMTIEFSSAIPLEAGASKSFSFFIGQSGSGTISATVTEPASSNNNTLSGRYL